MPTSVPFPLGYHLQTSIRMGKIAIAKSRALGTTETNWCKVVASGTGVTVTGILFKQVLSTLVVQAAVADVCASQPLLRARITKKDGKLRFEIKDELVLNVGLVDESNVEQVLNHEEESRDSTNGWLRFLEDEMNIPYSIEEPPPTLQVRLYLLPGQSSLLILRLHPAASDIASGAPVTSQLLRSLRHYVELENKGQNLKELLQTRGRISDFRAGDVIPLELPALEDAIPAGQAKKPFWAHGIDVVGYGLVSRRHSYLPFETLGTPGRSGLIRSALSEFYTEKLIKACEKRKTDLYGVVIAAGLKAVTKFKKVGSRGENYGVVAMLNCRKMLQPQISEDIAGFYHAAMIKTVHVTENVDTWELAAKCTREFNEAVKNRKHFTDMGDLNMLMVQAIAHPNLTPYGSMRTALLSIYHDPVNDSLDDLESLATSPLKVEDWATCSSTHGVGPCLGIFPFLRHGSLRMSFVYCMPLFSQATMQTLVDSIHQTLTDLN